MVNPTEPETAVAEEETLAHVEESEEAAQGLTPEDVSNVKAALEGEDRLALLDAISELHAADIADLLEQLRPERRAAFIEQRYHGLRY